MNILIICILLFTFTPKSKANNVETTEPITQSHQTKSTPGGNSNSDSTTLNASFTKGDNDESNQTTTSGNTNEATSDDETTNITNSTMPSNNTSQSPATSDDETTNITNSTMPSNNTSQSPAKEKTNGWTHVRGMILPFIMGMIFSSILFSTVFCTVLICNRCRTTDTNADKERVTLESVKHDQAIMLSDEDQADEQVPLQAQSFAEVSTNASIINSGTEEELKILEKDETQGTGDANDVPYASINFSFLQKKDDKVIKPQNVESDYAEIQLKKLNEEEEVVTLQDGVKQDGIKQDGVKQDGVNQIEVKQAEVKQDEVKQDGLEQGINGGLESQKQEE